MEKIWEAIRWTRKHIASEKVLVACHNGVGRSASVVIAYPCSFGFGYKGALDFVSSKRPKVNPMPEREKTIKESLSTQKGAPKCISQ